jgi:hypothetical protein
MTRRYRYRDREHVDYFEDTWAGQGLMDLPAAPPPARVKAGLQPVRIPEALRKRARREAGEQLLNAMVDDAQAAGWYDR